MYRKIRKIALLLAHIGVLLSLAFLVFFLVCSVRSGRVAKGDAAIDPKERYLAQAMNEDDFSVYTVGKALSDHTDPARETVFLIIDLIIPILFLAAGILLQIGSLHPRRKHTKANSQTSNIRR